MPEHMYLALDPGVSSGWAEFKLPTDWPIEIVAVGQATGGLDGIKPTLHNVDAGFYNLVVCEKFVPLAGGGFSHTLKSVEPLRIEGALEYAKDSAGIPIVYQRPQEMYRYGGDNLAERKKKARAFLREHGLLQTGKMVGHKDADDANSALLHAFAYAVNSGHVPTMRHYFGPRV